MSCFQVAQFTLSSNPVFLGIFDKFPEFFIKTLAKYDEELPPVSADYIHQLREGVKDLETFLKVTFPQVYSRLCVRCKMYLE